MWILGVGLHPQPKGPACGKSPETNPWSCGRETSGGARGGKPSVSKDGGGEDTPRGFCAWLACSLDARCLSLPAAADLELARDLLVAALVEALPVLGAVGAANRKLPGEMPSPVAGPVDRSAIIRIMSGRAGINRNRQT